MRSPPDETADHDRRLAEIARRADDAIDLGEGAALIGLAEDPVCGVAEVVRGLDELAASVRPQLHDGLSTLERVQELCRFLFAERGFSGNADDYYNVANSHLHRVLELRVGIPIALSVVLMEVGRRVGVELAGVGFPTHFLVAIVGSPGLFVDAFAGGQLLTYAECREFFVRRLGEGVAFEERFLQPVSSRSILVRMLRNLYGIHHQSRSDGAAIAACDRLLCFAPDSAEVYRDRALHCLRRTDLGGAAAGFRTYLERASTAADADQVRHYLAVVERRLAAYH